MDLGEGGGDDEFDIALDDAIENRPGRESSRGRGGRGGGGDRGKSKVSHHVHPIFSINSIPALNCSVLTLTDPQRYLATSVTPNTHSEAPRGETNKTRKNRPTISRDSMAVAAVEEAVVVEEEVEEVVVVAGVDAVVVAAAAEVELQAGAAIDLVRVGEPLAELDDSLVLGFDGSVIYAFMITCNMYDACSTIGLLISPHAPGCGRYKFYAQPEYINHVRMQHRQIEGKFLTDGLYGRHAARPA